MNELAPVCAGSNPANSAPADAGPCDQALTSAGVPISEYCKLPRVSGVYFIKNRTTGKYYVGSASAAGKHSIVARIGQHLSGLRRRKHYNSKLQNSFNKHGESAFVCGVIEECPSTKQALESCENRHIERLDCVKSGYNIAPLAYSSVGRVVSEVTKQRARVANVKVWSNPELRDRLSKRFKGINRNYCTQESHIKAGESLKKAYREGRKRPPKIDANWRAAINAGNLAYYSRPGVKEERKVLLDRNRNAKKAADSLEALYFKPAIVRGVLFNSPKEAGEEMWRMHISGSSWRAIATAFGREHKTTKRLALKYRPRECWLPGLEPQPK